MRLGAAAADGGLGDAQLDQDGLQRAELGEAALEQVGADEGGEPQPRHLRQVGLAVGVGEAQRDQDEGAGEDADVLIDGHCCLLPVGILMVANILAEGVERQGWNTGCVTLVT